jgi:hypothetical protein
MDRFVWEPGERLIIGTNVRPRTARDLLRTLEVENAPLDEQREAVEAWLLTTSEPPDPLLRVSLQRHGLPTSPVHFSRPVWGISVVITGATSTIEMEPLENAGLERPTRSGLLEPA